MQEERTVSPENFLETLEANVDNALIGDASFREFISNTLAIVDYKEPNKYKEKLDKIEGIITLAEEWIHEQMMPESENLLSALKDVTRMVRET